MELREQLYKNTNRKYYHGANWNKTINGYLKPTRLYGDVKEEPMVWLTTNVLYAIDYVGYDKNRNKYDPNGRVYILNLVDTANIFNIHQKTDRFWLLSQFTEKNIQIDEQKLDKMFSTDWTMLGFIKRNQLQRIIKDGNYDGFFNFEDGETYAPSIGLFDTEKAKIIDIVPSSEFKTKFAKQIEKGIKRAKIVLKENFGVNKRNALRAKIPIRMLREQMDILYGELFDDEEIWEDILYNEINSDYRKEL